MALGDNLLNKGLITKDQLEKALAEQKNTPNLRLGEILVKLGYVTAEQVQQAL